MVNVVRYIREMWTYALLPAGFAIGLYFDRWNDSRLTQFRNKSQLFQRELKPGEVPWR
ncbi:NADH dehydrogenase [ubiquinone] 1 beta subcomplex subunit 1 [Pseudophryne corroboree]|uniref:NADH dehydrogenase [ubiquinone] 1 beta subcomplex subunit 1 n=1 Tax=Pseudophryne corroboree TaxID=495146 RepID=UPI003081390D